MNDDEEAVEWLNKVFPGGHAKADIYGRPLFFLWFLPAQSIEIPEGMALSKDIKSINKIITDSFILHDKRAQNLLQESLRCQDLLKEEIKKIESNLEMLQILANELLNNNYLPYTLEEKDYRTRLKGALNATKSKIGKAC